MMLADIFENAEDTDTDTDADNPRAQTEPNRALIVFAHGYGNALYYTSDDEVQQWIQDCGGWSDNFNTLTCSADYACPGEGVFVAEMRLADDGPGDWPGSRESVLQLFDIRPATEDEWKAWLNGDIPWPAQGEDVP